MHRATVRPYPISTRAPSQNYAKSCKGKAGTKFYWEWARVINIFFYSILFFLLFFIR